MGCRDAGGVRSGSGHDLKAATNRHGGYGTEGMSDLFSLLAGPRGDSGDILIGGTEAAPRSGFRADAEIEHGLEGLKAWPRDCGCDNVNMGSSFVVVIMGRGDHGLGMSWFGVWDGLQVFSQRHGFGRVWAL
ncbi:hypothetical protein M0R45_008765 [Rubus argutus]|uniref:Uncharacterized protein n=1 Tax=Rubus argutus TaxID=59490 RepID=A0AAW1Y2P5_RUBAR